MSDKNQGQTPDPSFIVAPGFLGIDNPAHGKKSYPVASDGSQSWICATGTCTDEGYSEYASDVYVAISSQPPTSTTPPEGATHVAPVEGDWHIDYLYGAHWYYYGYGADNYLGAWANFPSTGWQRSVAHFKGLHSTHTYCDSPPVAPTPDLKEKFQDVLEKLGFQLGDYSPHRTAIMSAIASALTSTKGDPTSDADLIPTLYMESPFFHAPDHRVLLEFQDSPDGHTTVLSGLDPGTGTELELYGRFYRSAIGESVEDPGSKKKPAETPSFRLTCLMSSPIFPSLTSMNWTIHLDDLVKEAKGVFRNPKEVKLNLGLDDEPPGIPLMDCNHNNLFGPSPVPMRFVMEFSPAALKRLKNG